MSYKLAFESRMTGRAYQVSDGPYDKQWTFFLILGKDTEREHTFHCPKYFPTKEAALADLRKIVDGAMEVAAEHGVQAYDDLRTGVTHLLKKKSDTMAP